MSKYNDPRWQKKRLEIMSRDNFTCVACGSKDKTLHVHHEIYKGELWECPDKELQTLCVDCHELLGPHPFAGIGWERCTHTDSVNARYSNWCPQCGSKDLTDKGGFDRCNGCGNRIGYIDHPGYNEESAPRKAFISGDK